MTINSLFTYLEKNTREEVADFFKANPDDDIYSYMILQDIIDLINKYAEEKDTTIGSDQQLIQESRTIWPEVVVLANYNYELTDEGSYDQTKFVNYLASRFVRETYCSTWPVKLT